MSLFHIHDYSAVDKNGYQICTICKKSFWVGLPPVDPTFTILERIEFKNKRGRIYKIVFMQHCSETGELKSFTVKA